MAKNLKTLLCLLTLLFLFLSSSQHVTTTNAENFFCETLNPKTLALGSEKFTRLRFYFHDVLSGKDPTAVPVASAPTTNSSATGFGFVATIDDPLTVGPDPRSKRIGSAQGIYASASKTELGLLMVQTYAFTEGKLNGSTLSVLGRNAPFSAARELPVVGGSGRFRLARGYAVAKTHSYNKATRDAIVHYNVYVYHY